MVREGLQREEPSLRDKIFALIGESQTTPKQDLKALLQCAAQIKNRILIEQVVKECGLRCCGGKSNEFLELYYDLKRGQKEVGYISKGWDDPGFRIGELVTVPRTNVVAENVTALMRFCAVCGVALTMKDSAGSIEILMDSVIYSDGFNKKVFKQAIKYLGSCSDEAKKLFEA
jgi:hypothetical protein